MSAASPGLLLKAHQRVRLALTPSIDSTSERWTDVPTDAATRGGRRFLPRGWRHNRSRRQTAVWLMWWHAPVGAVRTSVSGKLPLNQEKTFSL